MVVVYPKKSRADLLLNFDQWQKLWHADRSRHSHHDAILLSWSIVVGVLRDLPTRSVHIPSRRGICTRVENKKGYESLGPCQLLLLFVSEPTLSATS